MPSNGGSITEVATLEYDTGKSEWNSIIQIDSDTYLVSYSGPDDDGFVCTIYISADGSTISKVASFEFETSYATSTALCKIDSDTYAVAYKGAGNDGFIQTLTIPADGSSITSVETLEFDE